MIPHKPSAILPPVLLLILLWVAQPSTAAQARNLTAVPTDVVEMEIATITLDPLSGAPLVLLRNPRGGELIPIFIGVAEAQAILFSLHGAELPRPMTHDLLRDVLTATGAKLERVYIDAVTDNTYLGMLELRQPGQEAPVLVDARPSDALALALRTDATIHIATQVLDSAREHQYGPLDSEQVATALGITVVAIDDDIRESLALPDLAGVIINQARGAAADAGLTAGMMIVRINGEPVDSPLRFLELVGATPEDEQVLVTVWQADGEVEFELDLLPIAPPQRGPAIQA